MPSTPASRRRPAIAAPPRSTAKQRSIDAKQRLAAYLSTQVCPPAPAPQLAGELHVLRLQHQALGREIQQRERALTS